MDVTNSFMGLEASLANDQKKRKKKKILTIYLPIGLGIAAIIISGIMLKKTKLFPEIRHLL